MTILQECMGSRKTRIIVAGLVFLLIISGYFTLTAQEPSPTCEEDLAATGQYVLMLKEHRDGLEVEIARLRYWKDFLDRQNKQIEAKLLELGSKRGKK